MMKMMMMMMNNVGDDDDDDDNDESVIKLSMNHELWTINCTSYIIKIHKDLHFLKTRSIYSVHES